MTKSEFIHMLESMPDNAIIKIRDHTGAIKDCEDFIKLYNLYHDDNDVYLLE
jgi:hypothetical protein